MDTLKKVTGTWQGTYSYEPVEQIPKLDSVPFTLTIKQGWFGRFTGTVTDGGPRGMPGTGIIKGYFSFPRIKFTKRMPVCYVATPDGRAIAMREYLAEQGHTCERDVPHMPISYEGEFVNASRAQGAWTIRADPVHLGDGRVVQITEARGSWNIESKVTHHALPRAAGSTVPSRSSPPWQHQKTRLQEFTAALREHLHRAKLIGYSLLLVVGVTQIFIRENFPEFHPPWVIIGTALMIILFSILLVPPLLMVVRARKKSESRRHELPKTPPTPPLACRSGDS